MALGHPVGAGVEVRLGVTGAGCPKTGGHQVFSVSCAREVCPHHHSCLEGLGHSSSPFQGDLTWWW